MPSDGDGAGHLFGNFRKYYAFHPPAERTRLLEGNGAYNAFLSCRAPPMVLADLGCNSGDLSVEVWRHAGRFVAPCHMIAVDLDPDLVDRAAEAHANEHVRFVAADVCSPDCRAILDAFLRDHGRVRFDVLCLFSMTMWIHMTFGDDALVDFLRYCTTIADGIVVEPQTWKSYQACRERCRRRKLPQPAQLASIRLRQDALLAAIDAVLTENDAFVGHVVGVTNWGRTITFYARRHG
ncbi:hypothetical protein PBRA_006885 [Plasmodiophora brassicae]|nr:hypothetical protein PBRA_006885 [Plasmodiophora brassicae]